MALYGKLKDRSAVVAVLGLGYVGLPLAVTKAKAGYTVIGIDPWQERVEEINRGKSYINDVSSEELSPFIENGMISATTDFSVIRKCDVIIICVPTPLTANKTPEMRYIESAVRDTTQHLKPDQLIILESTTYPGTTEELLKPELEKSGLKIGEDIFLVFSPERVDPGNKTHKTENIPKVIGGVTPKCTELAVVFYTNSVQNVFPVTSPKVAEMCKVFENTFRNVNIALVNELTQLCNEMKISVWEVISAASTKPFGYMPFYPGPGLGGHCIPLDPFYLSWKAKEYGLYTRFIELAGEVNDSMPRYVVEKIGRILNDRAKSIKGSTILLLGVAYKKDVADIRESPAIPIIKFLQELGANVLYHDPYLPQFDDHGLRMAQVELTDPVLESADCVVITTNHSCFDYEYIMEKSTVILDTRNATQKMISSDNVILL